MWGHCTCDDFVGAAKTSAKASVGTYLGRCTWKRSGSAPQQVFLHSLRNKGPKREVCLDGSFHFGTRLYSELELGTGTSMIHSSKSKEERSCRQ